MFSILITTILVSAFFILFFEPNWNSKNKRVIKEVKKLETFQQQMGLWKIRMMRLSCPGTLLN